MPIDIENDNLPTALKKLKAREDTLRQLESVSRIGSWETDLQTGVSLWSEQNYEIYGLFPVDQKKSNSFSIHLLGGYMVRDRFGVGAGLAYTYKKISFEANDTVDVNSIKIGYTIVPHIRNYIPLPRESFFQIFNQTNLGFSFLSGLEEDDNGTSIDRWSTDEFEFRLGIQPGISVFAGKGVTIEASIDVLGFTMTRTRIEHNGEFYGYHNTADLSFTLSLYTLALGITVYI